MPARRPPAVPTDYLTREQTVALLGIKADTLYTYVSRGLIRRIARPDGRRRRSLYFREDVEKARLRSVARLSEGVVAANALRYGEPIIPTAITEITGTGPRYRNELATDLAASRRSFESVSELLWSGLRLDEPIAWKLQPLPAPFIAFTRQLEGASSTPDIHQTFAILTLALGVAMRRSRSRIEESATLVTLARQLIQALSGCFGFLSSAHAYRPLRDGESIAASLASCAGVRPTADTIAALNKALILSADHELNPATFAARIAASSEADLHSCIAAAICAHSGARIARTCDSLETLFHAAPTRARLFRRSIDGELAGRAMPGFNHPLYPAGDPRARYLLDLIKSMRPRNRRVDELSGFIDEATVSLGVFPRMELAMVVLAIALKMPAHSASGLYTLGRIAGWVAHVMEQRLAGFLIRPRAKYAP